MSPDGKSGFKKRKKIREDFGLVMMSQLHNLVDMITEHVQGKEVALGGCPGRNTRGKPNDYDGTSEEEEEEGGEYS